MAGATYADVSVRVSGSEGSPALAFPTGQTACRSTTILSPSAPTRRLWYGSQPELRTNTCSERPESFVSRSVTVPSQELVSWDGLNGVGVETDVGKVKASRTFREFRASLHRLLRRSA